jgi:hypothetical protein
VVTLPLFVSGRVLTGGVQVLEHSSQLNRVFYEPGMFGGVDYLMTSSAVRGRFEADPPRYPTECAFYRFLDAHADVAARFSPRRGVAGPEIVVYRVGPRYRDALAAGGPVVPLWWRGAIPDSARARLEATGGLESLYAERIQSFVEAMGTELATLGRNEDALRFAQYTLAVRPGDVAASIVYGVCSGRLGKWDETREATEHAMASTPGARTDPALNLLHARSLERTGARAAAVRELRQIVARTDAADPIAAEAQRMIVSLSAPRVKGS